jgi:DNA polymerase
MFAIAQDDQAPILWSITDPNPRALELLKTAIDSRSLIFSHNSQFELAMSHYRMLPDIGIHPPHIDQWRCTLAMCRRAAAPESLAQAAQFFGLNAPKDPRGKALINLFSMGDSPILRNPIPWDEIVSLRGTGVKCTVREAWELFCEYCKQDVRVEQELHKKISHFELKGDVLASFQFDLRMNFRGVPVNLTALRNADGLVNRLNEKLKQRFVRMTGVNPTQIKVFQAWLKERGYKEKSLAAKVVDKVLENPPEDMSPLASEALKLRGMIGYSALAKIPTMIASACPDERVRGSMQWHAARTGRAGGRIIQPQNFKKSTIGSEAHLCYRMMCENWEDEWFEELWDSPLEAIASSIRHFIHPKEGGFLDGDYAQVEARIGPWLVGDTKKLHDIAQGVDLYKRIAVMVFGVKYENVTKEQRTIAKPIELSCIFGTGAKGLRKALATQYNTLRTLAECKEYVRTYRGNHTETVAAWRELEEAAKNAIYSAGKSFSACAGKVSFQCGKAAGIPYLTMRLPSGRRIYYPDPRIKPAFKEYDEEDMLEDPVKRQEKGYWVDQITFYGKETGKSNWTRVPTWGSRLLENCVQAIGADLLNRGCIEAEKRGYPICMIVHDQALCETSAATGDIEGFLEAMCVKDEWAADFPLEADGGIAPYYQKDD